MDVTVVVVNSRLGWAVHVRLFSILPNSMYLDVVVLLYNSIK